MVFASLTFLFYFLPLNILLYYIWDNKTYRNALLTAFSLIFYAWGEPVWILLLLFSAGIDYVHGLWVERFHGSRWALLGVWSSVILNLGLLALFKYNVFLYDNFNYVFGTNFQVPKYDLPIGISFYTFQTISYVIDVYRGEVRAQRNPLNFLLFVSLFHQLVAGPIVRYSHIANEIENREHKATDMQQGIVRFCVGLFKKVFIADVAGEIARNYLGFYNEQGAWAGDVSALSMGEAWLGVIAFSLQIYFDFSGYSDMAIGLGRMFGFHYHENFNYPYTARSATDFWRRWHISLGTFFRDYVYIPLGGNRRRGYLNLFIVWFLTGLWHGASWNFVLWGLYFGLLIFIERLFLLKFFERLPAFFSHIYLIFIAIIGWALFYYEDLWRLGHCLSVMFGFGQNGWWSFELTLKLQEHCIWLPLAFLLCLPLYPKIIVPWLENRLRTATPALYTLAIITFQMGLLLLSVAMLAGDTYKAFIYYRF